MYRCSRSVAHCYSL